MNTNVIEFCNSINITLKMIQVYYRVPGIYKYFNNYSINIDIFLESHSNFLYADSSKIHYLCSNLNIILA